ncbi:MAG: MFS transporter [candidate division Zixibacteria bacterium]|nr:MFS transporter [candidate division Zixibacteria bacterium]
MTDNPQKEKLWNKNFFLLWQGLLVSAMGDVIYAIALGFWILAETGSTALMGTLMAASAAPRVIISPFAGVIVDRSDRKWLLVLMDFIRGVCVILVAVAAFTGFIEIWMVFTAGIITGVCGAFFSPAVSSSIPDIVSKSKVVKANSVFSMIHSLSGVVSNSAGGFLFQILGAPLMFLVNGISYIFSAITELFVKIPKVVRDTAPVTFLEDLKDGFRFAWTFRGLRYLMLVAAGLNFFATMGIILLLPLFQQYDHLGAGLYGIVMGVSTAGLFLGMLLTSLYNFKPESRFRILMLCNFVFTICLIILPLYLNVIYMAGLMFIVGITNAIINVFVMSTAQVTVPQDKRGKVFALMGTMAGGLSPIAMAFGGVLAEFIPIRILISVSFIFMGIGFIPLLFSKSFKQFTNFDPEKQKLEDIL